MKRHLAHALRRTARRLIGWSNRLDRPMVTFEPPTEDQYTYEVSHTGGATWEPTPDMLLTIDQIKRAHEFRPR